MGFECDSDYNGGASVCIMNLVSKANIQIRPSLMEFLELLNIRRNLGKWKNVGFSWSSDYAEMIESV